MTSALIAALIAVLALGFLEGLARFYPSRQTWWRVRRARGRTVARLWRERFEHLATSRAPRRLATLLVCLVIIWIAAASLLDKRWWEVVFDVTPYVFVSIALMRTPAALRSIAERMKSYERDAGEDPDLDVSNNGHSTAVTL